MRKLLSLSIFFATGAGAQETVVDVIDTTYFIADTTPVELRAFPSGMKSKYSDAEFIYEAKSKTKNFWDRFLEMLSQWIKDLFDIGTAETSMNIAVTIVKVIAVLIIIAVIYFIVKAILNKEGNWIFGNNATKKVISYDDVERNIHLADFEQLIRDSILANEKRLSIRYYYLWLLKKMSERNIIVWDRDKTNSDYLYEVENTPYKDSFEYLSYLYNNIWYGEFDINDQTFDRAKLAFEKTIRTI